MTTVNLKCCAEKAKSSPGFFRSADVPAAVSEMSRFVFLFVDETSTTQPMGHQRYEGVKTSDV